MSHISRTEDIQLCGFLTKYEVAEGFTASRRRWAVLVSHCLYLYKNQNDEASIFSLLLPGCKVGVTYQQAIIQDPLIQITDTKGESIFITPEQETNFDTWYNLLAQSSSLKFADQRFITSDRRMSDYFIEEDPIDHVDAGFNYQTQAYPSSLSPASPNDDITGDHLIHYPSSRPTPSITPPPNRGSQQMSQYAPRQLQRGPPSPYNETPQQQPDRRRNSGTYTARPNYGSFNRGQPPRPQQQGQSYQQPVGNLQVDGLNRQPQQATPRQRLAMETVKEDPQMADSMVLETKTIDEIRRKYPVTGLAKRMSIAASDLLGKSHDELILLLIQLNREKANLERWQDYLSYTIGQLYGELRTGTNDRNIAFIEEKVVAYDEELNDVRSQIELSMPLITFIDNIVKMGGLYGGDDLLFASEYRKHLVAPQDHIPPKANLAFLRDEQERQIARDLASKLDLYDSSSPSGPSSDLWLTSGVNGQREESQEVRKTREELERELKELENVYRSLHGQKSQLAGYMASLSRTGLNPVIPNTLKSPISRAQTDNRNSSDLFLKYPRRSTRQTKRSDMTFSMRRPKKKEMKQIYPPRRQYSVPANRRVRSLPPNSLSSSMIRQPNHQTPNPTMIRQPIQQTPTSSMNRQPNHQTLPSSMYRQPSPQSSTLQDGWQLNSSGIDKRYPTSSLQPNSLHTPTSSTYRDSGRENNNISSRHMAADFSSPPPQNNKYHNDMEHPYENQQQNQLHIKPIQQIMQNSQPYTQPQESIPRGPDPLLGLSLSMRSETDLASLERHHPDVRGKDARSAQDLSYPPQPVQYDHRNTLATDYPVNDYRSRPSHPQYDHSKTLPASYRNEDNRSTRSSERIIDRHTDRHPTTNLQKSDVKSRSVQEQLNALIGLPVTTNQSAPDSHTESHRSSGPLIKLNPNHFKKDHTAASGRFSDDKALMKLASALEDFKGLEHGMVRKKGGPDERWRDGEETSSMSNRSHLYENLEDEGIREGAVRATYLSRTQLEPSSSSVSGSRPSTNFDQSYPRSRMDFSDMGNPDNRSWKSPNENFSFDHLLETPDMIDIGERYNPSQDFIDTEFLSDEKDNQIRQMVARQS